jgi:hypothetical protein
MRQAMRVGRAGEYAKDPGGGVRRTGVPMRFGPCRLFLSIGIVRGGVFDAKAGIHAIWPV